MPPLMIVRVEVSDHGLLLAKPHQTRIAEAVDVLMNPKDPLQARGLPLVGRLLNLECSLLT